MDDSDRLTFHPFDDDELLLAECYHENSKLAFSDIDTFTRITYFNSSPVGFKLMQRAAKFYACAERIDLPPSAELKGSLGSAINRRHSSQQFPGGTLSLTEIATLLKNTLGTTTFSESKGVWHRAIPSGGALFPTRLYLLPLDLPDLGPGAYHYEVFDHRLARFSDEPAEPELGKAITAPLALTTACAAFVLTASFERQRIKYRERSYRFCLMEAGHAAQNLLLAATSMGLGVLPVGGFIDDVVNEYLGLDGRDEAALYVILVGK